MPRDTRVKGSAATLEVALHGQPLVEVSGNLRGLDGFDMNEPEDDREIPGGGTQVGRQGLGYREGTSSFTCDENDVTRDLFWGNMGRRYDFRFRPQGEGSGLPQMTGEAIANITHTFEPRGVRRFTNNFEHDGLVTRTTQ